ncbi:hypothetical protein RDI58_010914 [Solanum bulbocastanum]|uniref:Uncharacterized protein n=1 Tax=Solanum bulbocastanum TaxID=147425 RepID=A0AAN8YJY6_SOLBU
MLPISFEVSDLCKISPAVVVEPPESGNSVDPKQRRRTTLHQPSRILEAECSKLEYLTTLSRVEISYSQGTTDALGKFPNLQHFDCNIMEPNNPRTHGNWFPKFDVLNKLESLILSYRDFRSSDN